jgi:hypothetical protein
MESRPVASRCTVRPARPFGDAEMRRHGRRQDARRRTVPPSQGGDTGSNPVGTAKKITPGQIQTPLITSAGFVDPVGLTPKEVPAGLVCHVALQHAISGPTPKGPSRSGGAARRRVSTLSVSPKPLTGELGLDSAAEFFGRCYPVLIPNIRSTTKLSSWASSVTSSASSSWDS